MKEKELAILLNIPRKELSDLRVPGNRGTFWVKDEEDGRTVIWLDAGKRFLSEHFQIGQIKEPVAPEIRTVGFVRRFPNPTIALFKDDHGEVMVQIKGPAKNFITNQRIRIQKDKTRDNWVMISPKPRWRGKEEL